MHPYTARIATIGGTGGGPFDHGQYLMQQGYNLGCGSKGMHLTTLHVERWQVLSHVSAVYTSLSKSSEKCTVPGIGNIRDEQKAVDIVIGPDDRVAVVNVDYGDRSSWSGADCLEYLRLEIHAADGTLRVASVEDPRRRVRYTTAPPLIISDSETSDVDTSDAEDELPLFSSHADTSDGSADIDDDYANYAEGTLRQVTIPEGLTLAGIGGRTGDSWDQVVLYVCPYLPGEGVWKRSLHNYYCKPFRKQVQTLLLCLHRLSKPSATSNNRDNTSPIQPSVRHLPPGMRESLAAALFHVTFMQGATAVDGGDESAMSEDDYIATWVDKEVADAMSRSPDTNP